MTPTDPSYADVAEVVELLEREAAGDLLGVEVTAQVVASRLGWRITGDEARTLGAIGEPDVARARAALEQAERDGVAASHGIAVRFWRLARHPLALVEDRPAVLEQRSDEGRRGYVDGFTALLAQARDWHRQGKSVEEFIAWADGALPLLAVEPERGLRPDLAHRRELAAGSTLELVPSDDDPRQREETDVPPIALILRSGVATIQDYLTPAAAQELGAAFMAIARVQSGLDAATADRRA